MKTTFYTLAAACLAGLVSGHGFISSPPARLAGPAMAAACGQQMFNNQDADHYGNIQGELQVATNQADFNAAACNVWVCKGFKYDDNKDKVQTYNVGDTIDMTFEIRAPHDGVANVSIVTSDGALVSSQPLKSWDKFALTSIPLTQQTDDTAFSITIPNVGDACATPGQCVIQHFWDARSIDQTYESCIDIVISSSGSGNGTSPPANASSSSVVVPTVPASSSSASSTDPTLSPTSAPTTIPLSTGTGLFSPTSISAPALPVNATSTKKPCSGKPKPTGTGVAGTGLPSGVAGAGPSGTGVSTLPSTLSTIVLPSLTPSASASPSVTGAVGTGAGMGPASSPSSIEQIITMIMQLIEGLVGQQGDGASS